MTVGEGYTLRYYDANGQHERQDLRESVGNVTIMSVVTRNKTKYRLWMASAKMREVEYREIES